MPQNLRVYESKGVAVGAIMFPLESRFEYCEKASSSDSKKSITSITPPMEVYLNRKD